MKIRARSAVIILYTIYIGLVLFLCLFQFSDLNIDLAKYFLRIRTDRIVHFIMFFPYPFITWLTVNYTSESGKNKMYSYLIVFISGVILAAIMELAQGYLTSGRQMDYGDFIANITGITVGLIIVHFIGNWMKRIFEKVFPNR